MKTTPPRARRRRVAALAVIASCVGLALSTSPAVGAAAGTASAADAAADSGPALSVPQDTLDQSVWCDSSATPTSGKRTVLLVHGVGFDAQDSWSWGYQRALTADGFAVCTVQIGNVGRGSALIGTEYVVNAIREARQRSGQDIAVIGHSAGPPLALWAMTYWPDVADSVDDMIGLAGAIKGTALANGVCLLDRCPALAWQLSERSSFVDALNSRQVSSDIDVTSLFSLTDEGIQPARRVSSYTGATNIAIQDHCPTRVVGHVGMLYDGTGYKLALDALTHPGPAVPSRVSGLCSSRILPEFDALGFARAGISGSAKYLGIVGEPFIPAEPPLPAYAAG